ncbi:hypothetical protein KCM76_24155 [Zooshikella marina]|uniref:hypothetical protein n=1 Tax=Zooshikella ganghwensis TaxID=202772 RepID=UPI001BAEE554|nr:hypothetical protein [Zooshikella ganghwensis]MBU2709111.1 hypothetical protein [Zooshikella ganghwensis]
MNRNNTNLLFLVIISLMPCVAISGDIEIGEDPKHYDDPTKNEVVNSGVKDYEPSILLSNYHDVKMNGKGNRWHVAGDIGYVSGIRILGRSDRSAEWFEYRHLYDVESSLVKDHTYTVQMQGKGNGYYTCNTNNVVTELYYYDEGDDSVERFRCSEVDSKKGKNVSVEGHTWKSVSNGWKTCSDKYAVTGFYYYDSGDDYIAEIRCSKIVVR